jgi:Zn-dependent peptidase ImmA (M78 family)
MITKKLTTSIPHLSTNEIEVKAEELIEFFNPDLLKKAQEIPIYQFVEETNKKFGIQFRCDLDLGTTKSGKKILGKYRIKPSSIFIDDSLRETDRFPFVLAHEYGHLILHKNIDPQKIGYIDSSIEDTHHDLVSGKKILETPKDWIEWQANRFASALLMPRSTFINALIDFQVKQGIKKNIGIVYLENIPYSMREFNNNISHLANLYRVNRTNVEYRLTDLEILVDLRLKNVKHISELLKEETPTSQ